VKIFCNQKNLIMTEVVNFSKVCSNVYLIEMTRKYECDKVRLGSCLLTFHINLCSRGSSHSFSNLPRNVNKQMFFRVSSRDLIVYRSRNRQGTHLARLKVGILSCHRFRLACVIRILSSVNANSVHGSLK
jgi:hypothetical protein